MLLGKYFIPYPSNFILSEFFPKIFDDKSMIKVCKFYGRYYYPSINIYEFYVFSPNLLSDNNNAKFCKLKGSCFISFPNQF